MKKKGLIYYCKKALFVCWQIIKGLFLFLLVPFYCLKEKKEE